MVARVDLPPPLGVKNPDPCLQNFVNQADWDEQAVSRPDRVHLAGTFASPEALFVIDDTTFPKQGSPSVGVERPPRGAVGKKANGQCAVSLHYVSAPGPHPLTMRLDRPEVGIDDPRRWAKADVPTALRRLKTQGPIALELRDQVGGAGLPGKVVVADAGSGVASRRTSAMRWRRGGCPTSWG